MANLRHLESRAPSKPTAQHTAQDGSERSAQEASSKQQASLHQPETDTPAAGHRLIGLTFGFGKDVNLDDEEEQHEDDAQHFAHLLEIVVGR